MSNKIFYALNLSDFNSHGITIFYLFETKEFSQEEYISFLRVIFVVSYPNKYHTNYEKKSNAAFISNSFH